MEGDTTAIIRHLNDELRCHGRGGRMMMTIGIQALGADKIASVARAVAAFSDFTEDNDPHGEHDCAVLTVEDTKIIWKIDCYDKELKYGSENPADPLITTRVLTIMLAEEY